MTPSAVPSPTLVTGAGGLIGSAVVRELAGLGLPVRAMLAPDESAENVEAVDGVEILRGDVRDAGRIFELARGNGSIVHCAALNTLWHRPARDYYSINVKGTQNVCEAAMAARVRRLVFTSSCEVMGPAIRNSILDERAPLSISRVKGHYERSKFLAELAVLEFGRRGLSANVIRPTAVVGPGDIHTSPPGMLIKAFLERRIPAYFDAGINVVDSRDVALAHVMALASERDARVYIVGGHNLWMHDLIDELSRASGTPGPTRRVGYRTALAAAIVREAAALFTRGHPGITIDGIRTIRHAWHFDTARAREELGLRPRPLAETIRDAVEWYLKAVTRDSSACRTGR